MCFLSWPNWLSSVVSSPSRSASSILWRPVAKDFLDIVKSTGASCVLFSPTLFAIILTLPVFFSLFARSLRAFGRSSSYFCPWLWSFSSSCSWLLFRLASALLFSLIGFSICLLDGRSNLLMCFLWNFAIIALFLYLYELMRFKFIFGDKDFCIFLAEHNSAASDWLDSIATPSRDELVRCDEVVNKLRIDNFDWLRLSPHEFPPSRSEL